MHNCSNNATTTDTTTEVVILPDTITTTTTTGGNTDHPNGTGRPKEEEVVDMMAHQDGNTDYLSLFNVY
jgi:hypothetical protein